MTHSGGKPHTNVGDIGQRYEVRATGYPKADESVIGWAPTLEGANKMAAAIRQAPSCTGTTIRDRTASPHYAETFCSQCGKSFGPGDSGFSHCEHHQEGRPTAARETWRRVFATRAEAEEFLRERGFSVGHMQADQPRGVMLGRWDIRKWRDLWSDRPKLHGIMSTLLTGKAVVTIYATAPVEAHVAIRQRDKVPA